MAGLFVSALFLAGAGIAAVTILVNAIGVTICFGEWSLIAYKGWRQIMNDAGAEQRQRILELANANGASLTDGAIRDWRLQPEVLGEIAANVEKWEPASIDPDKIWEIVRDHVKHEDLLTEQRVYNMMTFQAALAVFATVVGYFFTIHVPPSVAIFAIILPVFIGLLHAGVSCVLLMFSAKACGKWAATWLVYSAKYDINHLPDVIGERSVGRSTHGGLAGRCIDGINLHRSYPFLFLIAWTGILVLISVAYVYKLFE